MLFKKYNDKYDITVFNSCFDVIVESSAINTIFLTKENTIYFYFRY